MSQPDFKTFDLADALAGISYPEKEFPVFFDMQAAQKINAQSRELLRHEAGSEEYEEAARVHSELLDRFKGSAYKFTIRGVAPELTREISIRTLRQVAATVSSNSQENQIIETEIARDEAENETWALMIVKIENPDGAVITAITPEMAKDLRGRLPEPAIQYIESKIEEMREETEQGYYLGITDYDFLYEA